MYALDEPGIYSAGVMGRCLPAGLICSWLAISLLLPSETQSVGGNGYQSFELPATDDQPARPPTFAAVLLGGNGDVDEAARYLCDHSHGGEIVVLRATGDDSYNPYFHDICKKNAVITIVTSRRDGAQDPFVAEKIRGAHAIFISGGDQGNYVKLWTGTPVQAEVNRAVASGVPIGGASAGLAVQGEFAFSAMHDTVTSDEALTNPYDERVTIERNFLVTPVLQGIITDSHFTQRSRMGRTVVFLSRIGAAGWTREPHAIGVDEATAVLVDAQGKARVVGTNAAYFIALRERPEVCVPGKALTVRNLTVHRIEAGTATFDLKSWSGMGGSDFTVDVVDGQMTQR